MNHDFLTGLERRVRGALPVSLTFILVLLSVVPLPIDHYGRVAPALPLMGVYYWSMYRPELMPPSAIFMLGAVQDLLGGGHLGVTTLIFLATYQAALKMRPVVAGRPLIVSWFAFAPVVAGAGLVEWLAPTIAHFVLPSAWPGLFRGLLTLALYPCLAILFYLVELGLPRPVPHAAR